MAMDGDFPVPRICWTAGALLKFYVQRRTDEQWGCDATEDAAHEWFLNCAAKPVRGRKASSTFAEPPGLIAHLYIELRRRLNRTIDNV